MQLTDLSWSVGRIVKTMQVQINPVNSSLFPAELVGSGPETSKTGLEPVIMQWVRSFPVQSDWIARQPDYPRLDKRGSTVSELC